MDELAPKSVWDKKYPQGQHWVVKQDERDNKKWKIKFAWWPVRIWLEAKWEADVIIWLLPYEEVAYENDRGMWCICRRHPTAKHWAQESR